MEALGGSYLKLFVSRQREKERVALSRHEFGFLVHHKRVGDGLVSFRAKGVGSISTAASVHVIPKFANLEREEIQKVNSDRPKTVRVRFKLHRQCAFGQQFLVLGDDPNLGLWDPADGVPLNWSEGHAWTAEVDIPSSKVVSYKFILTGINGTLSWQPGRDRVLETWDTAKTISVTEDWDIPDFQFIEEEELDPKESSLNDLGLLIAENLKQIAVEQGNDVMKERVGGTQRTSGHSDEPFTLMVAENITVELGEQDTLMVAENITVELGEQDLSLSDEEQEVNGMVVMNGRLKERVGGTQRTSGHSDEPFMLMVAENITVELGEQDLSLSDEELEENGRVVMNGRLITMEGVPVLVPGIATLPPEGTEAEEVKMETSSTVGSTVGSTVEIEVSADLNPKNNSIVEDTTTESAATEAEVITTPLSDEIEVSTESAATEAEIRVSASLHYAETKVVEEKPRFNGEKLMESSILDNNMQWGRTLQNFLVNLGFMQHS